MAAKKRRLMPDLDELQYKRGQTKSAIKGVEAAVRQLKEIDLMSMTSSVNASILVHLNEMEKAVDQTHFSGRHEKGSLGTG